MIQQAFMDFSIVADVTVTNGTAQMVTLGPTQPVATSADNVLSLSLLGDLASYTSLPAVTGEYLLVPAPNGAPQVALSYDRPCRDPALSPWSFRLHRMCCVHDSAFSFT